MNRRILTAIGILWAASSPVPSSAQSAAARDSALHLLNRIAFGPRPEDVERVAAMGVLNYLDLQLAPERIPDPEAEERIAKLEVFKLGTAELAARFESERRALRERLQTGDSLTPRPRMDNSFRRLTAELQQAAVIRAVVSERQLYEVMVDFWTNHFNVFLAKGAVRFLLPEYLERAIRPHAMGRFEDLLLATARSPAMLFYLDNVQSVAPGARPPGFAMRNPRRPSNRPLPTGLNENYARELLELHTVGIEAGYTQEDVVNVARILTGWSMTPPQRGARFVFNRWAHDRGEKVVLGKTFPAGRDEEEGIELLRFLARHPSTMRHVSRKLCARFVSDDPPDGCIDAAVKAWEKSGGEIRAVLRAILTSPEFWAPQNRGAKIKTPLEFVASAIRALDGEPDTTLALGQMVGRLGQPLYLYQPPTGYPETQESWVSSSALLDRFNLALALASNRRPGATVDLDRLIPPSAVADSLVTAVNRVIFHGTASAETLEVIRKEISGLPPIQARNLAVGLALGSPEFQRQ
ncbi:hypothetical protein HRbin33_00707 [bacterium HR33]|nr:hypothetical protein HRbin33_00707 [bacterium HR33]